jgi:hypothetical protein
MIPRKKYDGQSISWGVFNGRKTKRELGWDGWGLDGHFDVMK